MSEAETFFETLFGYKPDDSYLLIWTLPDKHSRWFRDLGQAARYAEGRAAEFDVYFGVALASQPYGDGERLKRGEREPAGIYGMWCDIDIAGAGHVDGKKAYPPTLQDAFRLVGSMGLEPTVVVHSGGGIHCHYAFKVPWMFDSEDERDEARVLAHRWKETLKRRAETLGWSVDSVGDLERVLRVPGTLNHKEADHPRPVRML